MARFNSSTLVFELLENRCLLNGTFLSTALFTQARDPISQPVTARLDQVSADSADCGPTQDARFVPQSETMLSNASSGGFTPRVLKQAQTWAPMQGLAPSAPSLVNEEPPPVAQNSSSGHGLLNQQPSFHPAVPVTISTPQPRIVIVGVEQFPQVDVIAPKHPIPLATAEDDVSAPHLSLASVSPPPAGKDQSSLSHPNDPSAAANQTGLLGSQPSAKEDRPGSAPLAQAQPPGVNGALTSLIDQAVQLPQIAPQTSQVATAMLSIFARSAGSETRLTEDGLSGPLSASVFESAWASSAALFTNVLPVDFSSLDSSVKDFFDRMDRLADKLSASQANLLFSSGVAAVAATLALEWARRKLLPAAPAVLLQPGVAIPYSDYQ